MRWLRPAGVRSRRRLELLIVAGCLLVSAGCGYTIDRAPGAADPAAPSLAIRRLTNDSSEPGIERVVSEALRREWLRRGRFRLVSDPARADWVISGRVLPLLVQTRTLSSVVLSLEQTLVLRVELDLRPMDGESGLGAPRRLPPQLLRESELYFASADVEAARKNRSEAIHRVAGLVAERVVEAVDIEVER